MQLDTIKFCSKAGSDIINKVQLNYARLNTRCNAVLETVKTNSTCRDKIHILSASRHFKLIKSCSNSSHYTIETSYNHFQNVSSAARQSSNEINSGSRTWHRSTFVRMEHLVPIADTRTVEKSLVKLTPKN